MSGITWIASYPRSGNTWTRLALWSLRSGQPVAFDILPHFAELAIGYRLFDKLLECDAELLTYEEVEELRPDLHHALLCQHSDLLVKVHDAWRRTRTGRPVHDPKITHATIYLIRDPRDVAVSWAQFLAKPLDWAVEFLANPLAMVGGEAHKGRQTAAQHVGSWSDNVISWIDQSSLRPLVIRYEDLLTDTAGALRLMAETLNWDVTEESIAMAVAATRFDRLSQLESQTGFVQRPATTDRFFRTGRAQGWRDVLSKTQSERIEREHGAVMARFAYC